MDDKGLALTVLGSRCGMPRDREPSSGYLVSAEGTAVLMDCGPGVAGPVSSFIETSGLDALLITHMHCDHCYDILPIARALVGSRMSYPDGNGEPTLEPGRKIPLYVPRGSRPMFMTLQSLFPVDTAPPLNRAIELAFELQEYEAGDLLTAGSFTIEPFWVRHAAVACGFRVSTPDGTLAYTGDTGWSETLLDLAHDCDVLLCEATLRNSDPGPHGHLSAREAGRLAAEAGVRTLVLTHLKNTEPDWLEALLADATSEFDGSILLARSGARLTPTAPGRILDTDAEFS